MIIPKIYCSCGQELEIVAVGTHVIGEGKINVNPCPKCSNEKYINITSKTNYPTCGAPTDEEFNYNSSR